MAKFSSMNGSKGNSSMGPTISKLTPTQPATTPTVGGQSGNPGSSMANMPAHNVTGTRGSRVKMGNTKHPNGQAPGYLK